MGGCNKARPPLTPPTSSGGESEEELLEVRQTRRGASEAACRDNVGQAGVKEGRRSERRCIFTPPTLHHHHHHYPSPHPVSNLASVIAPAAGFMLRSDAQEHKKSSRRVPALSMATDNGAQSMQLIFLFKKNLSDGFQVELRTESRSRNQKCFFFFLLAGIHLSEKIRLKSTKAHFKDPVCNSRRF